MAPLKWFGARAMDAIPTRTDSWSSILMKQASFAGFLINISAVTVWEQLLPTWRIKGILSPTEKSKRNREALNKLLSNEKCMGRVQLQKSVSVGGSQIENDGLMDRHLYSNLHEVILSDKIFEVVQQEKTQRLNRLNSPKRDLRCRYYSDRIKAN